MTSNYKNNLYIKSFDWDDGNLTKNSTKHDVSFKESEAIFFDSPVYFSDKKHSRKEERYVAYGYIESGRKLTIIFTFRREKIRIISARDQNKKERKIYTKFADEYA